MNISKFSFTQLERYLSKRLTILGHVTDTCWRFWVHKLKMKDVKVESIKMELKFINISCQNIWAASIDTFEIILEWCWRKCGLIPSCQRRPFNIYKVSTYQYKSVANGSIARAEWPIAADSKNECRKSGSCSPNWVNKLPKYLQSGNLRYGWLYKMYLDVYYIQFCGNDHEGALLMVLL